MVQLNKHFHLNYCIITAKAIYSLALIYFIEFHKFHFTFYVKTYIERNILLLGPNQNLWNSNTLQPTYSTFFDSLPEAAS